MKIPWGAYYELTKPRIVFMVLVTAVWGYFLGGSGSFVGMLTDTTFWVTMLGTGLGAAGAAVLNQYLERDSDGVMERTRHRPLPAGVIEPLPALAFGLWLALIGIAILLFWVNLLTAFLVLLTNFLYVLVYTPMKRLSAINTTFGAIPGAMPPLIGWTAAHGGVSMEGVLLFLILFVWQHPHVYAIGWMYREDYARAGYKMLSLHDNDGARTVRGVWWGTLALIAVSVLPVWTGMAGTAYLAVALVMGVALLVYGRRLAQTRTIPAARRVLLATIIYLPVILAGILLDAIL
ncbi:MAG: heme o synthase [Verrucomicrobia bacterium]|nr:heme o synthase [Verrucomicrobiota bacterium]